MTFWFSGKRTSLRFSAIVLPVTGDAVAVQDPGVEQLLHHDRDAAGAVKVEGRVFAAGHQVGDIGRAAHDRRHFHQVEVDARLVGDRRQMQAGVGRAAGGGDDDRGVLKRLARDDVARPDLALDQRHHRLAARLAEAVAALIGRRRARRIRQRQPERLGNAGHRVGGVLAAARAAGRQRHLLELLEVGVAHALGRVGADALEHVDDGHVLAVELARHDRAAVDEDRRHVEPHHRHHQRRQGLVAAGEADQRVVAMRAHRQLDRIRDDLAADQRRLHAGMAHGDAVGDGDGRELARRAAGGHDALLHRLRLARQRDVARRRLVPGRHDADERLGDLLLRKPHRIEHRAVRRAGRPDRGVAAGQLGFVECRCGHRRFPRRRLKASRRARYKVPAGLNRGRAGAAPMRGGRFPLSLPPAEPEPCRAYHLCR